MKYIVPKNVTGVYGIRHKPTGQMYVGSSGYCIYNRFRHHFVKLRQGKHATPKLQVLWNESSPEDFEQVLFELCDRDHKQLELRYIAEHQHHLLNGSADGARKRWANPEYRAAVTQAARESATKRHQDRTFGRASWNEKSVRSWREKMNYD